ncbi:MAG: hypothetical protein ACF8XB_22790 [Planctomycetota bacterium JB042]
MSLRSVGRFLILPGVLVAALGAPAALGQAAGEIMFNEKFLGLIDSSLDEDLIQFEEVAGSTLKVTVTANSGNNLHPGLELLDDAMTPIDVGSALKLKKKKAQIKGFELPATGVYYVRVTSANQLTGTYKAVIKGSAPKKYQGTATISAPGEIDEIEFHARAGSKLKGSIEQVTGDVQPFAIELVGPGGVLAAIAGGIETNPEVTEVSLKKIDLPSFGTYRLRITGQSGTTGEYAWNFKVVPPDPVKGKVYEDGHPQDNGTPSDGFTLEDISFGRGLKTLEGLTLDVVSPFSVVQTDPISDLPVPGTLKPLFLGGSLSQLVSFNLGPIYGPPIVPRNAVLVLHFTKKVDLESMNLDEDGVLTEDSPIQVEVNGDLVAFEVFADGKDLILSPAFGDQVGMPAGPVSFDAAGNPTADLFGAGELVIFGTGENPLRSQTGSTYEPRQDLLASVDAGGEPVGFNPGNQVLDFFDQTDVGVGSKSYGGFLPDESAPRLVRELAFDHTYDPNFANPALGDVLGPDFISLVLTEEFNDEAKNGDGEWAGGVLRLRAEGPNREEHVIVRNTVVPLGGGFFRNEIQLATTIVIPPAVGEEFQLVRAEYFEPDLNNPIDLAVYDPDNPELSNNTELINFVEVRDRMGNVIDVNSPIDSLATFTFRFSEPMLLESFRPYETFFVSDNPQIDNFGINFVGAVDASSGGKAMTFKPYREIQFGPLAGTDRPVGFGKAAKSLRMHIKVVPPPDVLAGLLGVAGFEEFEGEGHRGVTDLGGQPLGFPVSFLSPSEPFIDFSFAFTTAGDAALPNAGAIAQRFLGRPTTGFDSLGNTGIAFRDVPESICGNGVNLYGPRIADLNLFTNGFLSGAPVQFFTKVHDDFNPPLDINGDATQMNPFPFGTSTPIGGFSVLGGAKLQHVYRAVDASPDWESLAGTNLDLYHIAYAPIGGFVTDTVLPDISVHAGHTAFIPDTRQGGGIPGHPNSGLTATFESNYNAVEKASGITHERQLVVGTDNGGGSYTGNAFTISNSLMFKPIGTQNNYHPIPDVPFDHPFAYNNGALDVATFSGPQFSGQAQTWGGKNGDNRPESLLLEYRVRVVDPENPPSTSNGFTFAVGVLSSAIPRFRVFTIGTGCLSCCFSGSGGCAANCLISFGPAMDGQAGNGGPPLDPDSIVNAAGPAPAPPGLTCRCLKPPQNPQTPPAGCADQGPNAPTMDQVATGAAGNPSGNNYGDNSRYFMVFNYVKRESYLRSPFVRVQPGDGPAAVVNPTFLTPIFDPPLDSIPDGTTFDVRFRSSVSGGLEGLDATAWVTPQQMASTNHAINQTPNTPFLQFEAEVEANTSTQLTPIFDDVIVPFTY